MVEKLREPRATEARGTDTAVQRVRPAHVTVGAGILIAAGAFVALVGLALVVIGILYQDPGSLPAGADLAPSGLSTVAYLAGVGAIVYGIGQTASGIGTLRGDPWARAAGILMAAIGAGLAAAGVLRVGGSTAGGATIVFVPVVAGYVYAAWALAAHHRWFSRRA